MEQEVLDLRQVPNEFIIAAYNMAAGKKLNIYGCSTDSNNYEKEMRLFMDPTASPREPELMRFLTVIHPNNDEIVKKMQESCLSHYKNCLVGISQNTQLEQLMSSSFENKVNALRHNAIEWMTFVKQIQKDNERFKHLLKMYLSWKGNFNEFVPVYLMSPNNEKLGVVIFQNYVFAIDQEEGLKYDFYTKGQEAYIDILKKKLYTENLFSSEAETPAECE